MRASTAAALLLLAAVGVFLGAPSRAMANAKPVALGVYVPHADENPSLVESFAEEVGWRPLIIDSFKTFDQAPIYLSQLDGIHGDGAVPMITWEPQTSSEGLIRLSKIAGGSYDGYLSSAAREAAAWGKPLMIRFGQEMNGGWYPWSPAHGNSAQSYVMAWRHIVRLFRREGADNVKWVWTPYVKTRNDLRFARFYPGDDYVDWVGLDAYNWGGTFAWQSFHDLVSGSYRELLRITSRPLMVAEVGCGEIGGNKAAWLRQMLDGDIPRMRHIRAVVWFDDTDSKGDLRIDTSNAALSTFRRLTRMSVYASNLRQLLGTPGRLLRSSGRVSGVAAQ